MAAEEDSTRVAQEAEQAFRHALDGYNKLSSFEQWLTSMSCIVGTARQDQKLQCIAAHHDKYRQPMIERCAKNRDFLFESSPVVRFMLDELEKLGCVTGKEQVECAPCFGYKGGFAPLTGIRLCSNQVTKTSEAEKTLVHELIHAFDQCRFKVDWANPRHHACAEVRAANLSGECGWWREYKGGQTGITGIARHHQECVRRRATAALVANPAVHSKEEAEFYVSAVFDACFRDTRPFERIY
ncbi:Mitochondrial inner membrane protease atp23 [Savitreella phatthalungensis]